MMSLYSLSLAAMLFLIAVLSHGISTVTSFAPLPIRLNTAPSTHRSTPSSSSLFLYIDNSTMPAAGARRPRPQQIRPKDLIQHVDTMDEFNSVVLQRNDDDDSIVVVRFHSPYCKACQATHVAYDRLVQRNAKKNVKFVDVSLTDKNEDIREKLGIEGVPFAHIYVPDNGLVEELPMSRRHMAKFKKTLGWYVKGECDVPDDFFENPHQPFENENLIL